jgi:hypothetical protein
MSNKSNKAKQERPVQDVDPVDPVGPSQDEKSWILSIGLYPGILVGIRTYEEEDFKTHVLYLPFVNIALEIDN